MLRKLNQTDREKLIEVRASFKPLTNNKKTTKLKIVGKIKSTTNYINLIQ
jgi:hypothetical protein